MIISLVSFLIALTIHEASHAWAADRLGDPTARVKGRLSLNPLAHIDIYGTILIPLLLTLAQSPLVFGWAKPVLFDPFNLKNPRRDSAIISLAGPLSNILLSVILSILLRTYGFYHFGETFIEFLVRIIDINIILAFFNLLPIHPLDGGKIFVGLLPEDQAYEADIFLKRYGFIILIFLVFPLWNGISPLFSVLIPVRHFLLKFLLGAGIT